MISGNLQSKVELARGRYRRIEKTTVDVKLSSKESIYIWKKTFSQIDES